MPRRRVIAERKVIPDPVFKSEMIVKFVNCVMKDGKKSVAEKIVYGALAEALNQKKQLKGDVQTGIFDAVNHKPALELFEDSLNKVRPTVEVKARRVGGATYQVPMEVRPKRGMALAMRWLIDSARKRNEKTMTLRLAREFNDALEGRGNAIKKREEMHRMAKANQAFAHYRW